MEAKHRHHEARAEPQPTGGDGTVGESGYCMKNDRKIYTNGWANTTMDIQYTKTVKIETSKETANKLREEIQKVSNSDSVMKVSFLRSVNAIDVLQRTRVNPKRRRRDARVKSPKKTRNTSRQLLPKQQPNRQTKKPDVEDHHRTDNKEFENKQVLIEFNTASGSKSS